MRFCGHCGTPSAAGAATAAGSSTAEPPASSVPTADDAEPQPDALRSFVTGQVADRLIESGGDISEERRLVTALFADLSGFTPLSERLDAEELLEVIDPIIRALSDIVGRYEGFVEKFAGDALLALFGAPIAHEDDAVRALLVADEMHGELARMRTQLGPDAADLTLHIGINTGHGVARLIGSAVRMDYAVLGDSVILAQRLESAAPPGETYLGETTERLVRDQFELEPVGPLTIKGKAEPVPAWRVIGQKAAAEQRATGERHTAPLVGRSLEVGALTAVLDALADGAGGVMTLVGEPGVGKSRLTDEARLAASARGIRWLEARCLSYGAGLTYWPYLDLLRRMAGINVEDAPQDAAERLREMLAELGRPELLPYLARPLGLPPSSHDPTAGLEPEAIRRAFHDAVAGWLRALTIEQPVVLAIQDGHWADASSIALTLELARALSAERVMLFLTARPSEGGLVDQTHATDARIALAIHLEPLDEAGVSELAAYLLGNGAPPDRLIGVLAERGAGNPFFVQETVRSLLERGVLHRPGERWELRPGWEVSDVPATIEGVLAARLDALSTASARLLGVASVIGRRVRIRLLQAVVGAPDLGQELGELEAAGFLDRTVEPREEAVAFHHALMQEVAYGRLIRRRRRALHLRTAEAAESLYGSGGDVVDLLARHLYLGAAGSRAIAFLLRAGDRARSMFANEEAILDYTRAVELVRADPAEIGRLPELLLILADLHELVGNYDEARRLHEEVRDLTGDVRAWRGIAAALRKQGHYPEALASLDAAFVATEGAAADLRPLWLERGWTLSMLGHTRDAAAALRTGLASNGREDAWTARLLLELGRIAAVTGTAADALEDVLAAGRIFDRIADTSGHATALRVLGGLYDDLERYDEAAGALGGALAAAERAGNAEELGGSLINLGVTQTHRGELDSAVSLNLRALAEFERIGHVSGRAVAHVNLGDILARQGDYGGAMEHAERALAITASAGHQLLMADALKTKAIILLGQGLAEDARDASEQAARMFEDAGAEPMAREARAIADQAAAP
jgi:class 3 adenylate cyclase/tetratricopeptide (TPR) repeat protein